MGSVGDNLLKLTGFPFSYSLIGLLALIFGEGLNIGEASLEKLGPLLILMGFAATTLSITDPIGRIQKLFLIGRHLKKQLSFVKGRLHNIREEDIQGQERGAKRESVRDAFSYPKYQYLGQLSAMSLVMM